MNQMPYDEFVGWTAYFERRPLDWRDDLRAAYIMNSFGVKKAPQEIFPSLKSILDSKESRELANSLKTSSIFQRMLSAKGGTNLQALKEA
jgi:hypothetical protein